MFIGITRAAFGQPRGKDVEWPTYGADLANTKYRPLDQIDATNFNKLEVAWRFKTDNLGTRPEFRLEGTPLMVNGVLYATAGTRRSVVALDAASGELLWTHGEHEGARGAAAPRQLSGRGLAYWSDGKQQRILYVTPGYRLIALDAKTGGAIPTFGKNGAVDLKLDDDQNIFPDLTTGEIGIQSAPVVAKDTVIVGAAFREGMTPKSFHNNKGYVRGFDVRTGKRLWIFHTIPMKGEFGYETWLNRSAEYTGNTGLWTQLSVDEELGLAYLPIESPTGDYYGGHRPGTNLFGESLVCVDLKTGQRKWHYQLVHHPLWDMDISSAPILADINVNGRAVKAVAQPTKQGILYVFDRVTGEPVWPIEERHKRAGHGRDEPFIGGTIDRKRLCVANRERPPRLYHMRAKTEAVAFCGREQIGLELDRQHRGVRRHERERRIAAGAIQSSCDNAGMHEAMLLRIGSLVRHCQFDFSRRQPCDGDT